MDGTFRPPITFRTRFRFAVPQEGGKLVEESLAAGEARADGRVCCKFNS